MAKGSKGGAAVIEDDDDVEVLDDDDDELETAPPKGKGKKAAAEDEVTFGASDLAKLLSSKTGKEISTKDLRTLLRKMAREDNPRIQREVIPGNKSRYSWSGPDDPEVKKIIKAVTGGELEQGKKEALAKLKESKAKKAAESNGDAKAGKKGKKGKAAPAPAAEADEDFDLNDDDDD